MEVVFVRFAGHGAAPLRCPYSQKTKAMGTEYFPGIPRIACEDPQPKNPFAFKHYNPDELVEGKRMRKPTRTPTSTKTSIPSCRNYRTQLTRITSHCLASQ